MPIVSFARAVRKGAHVIVTAYGESGCGKTYSLIRLGRGLVGPNGKLGLLDTETGRGLIYATLGGGYEYAELTPPFTPERYVEAIDAAEEAGIEALIIDSGSLEWEGLGGVLEIADANNIKGLVKWAGPKARHKRYVQRLLNSRMHLLIALRAKEKMVQLTDKTPIPKGMKIGDIISAGYVPIQNKRFIFETTVQLFLPTSTDRRRLGIPIVEKCPEDLWDAFPEGEQISEETGRRIAEWIGGGAPVDHGLERMRRNAEEAAGGGTEALREHWRGLDKAARQRLSGLTDNLASIASAADNEQELRRREEVQAAEQTDPNLDNPFGGRGIEFAGDATNTPAGTPHTERKEETTGRSARSDTPAADKPTETAGDAAMDGQSLGADTDDRLAVSHLALGERTLNVSVAPSTSDLLGDPPAGEQDDLRVPLPPDADLAYVARTLLALIEDQPTERKRIALVNAAAINRLRVEAPELHAQVQAVLDQRQAIAGGG